MAAIILTTRPGILLAVELRILLPGLYLAGSLLVAAAVLAIARRLWRTAEEEEDRSIRPGDQLAHYRTLYEQGAISEEEFKRLRAILGGELRKSMDLPAVHAPADVKPVEPGPVDALKPPPGDSGPPPDGVCSA